ncbi:hypothetical protein D9M69_361140 [compost metagenome]
MGFVVLRVVQGDRQVQPVHGAAGLHAEGAGIELVEREAGAFFRDPGLCLRAAAQLARAGDEVEEDDQLAQADS